MNASSRTLADSPSNKKPASGGGSRSIRVAVSIAALSVALALLSNNYDLSKVGQDFDALTLPVVAIVSVALLSNTLVAVIRFKIIANDMGDAMSWRRAMATVSAGSLAGALFFQLAGQLIARSAIMRRSGVPFANVVVITLYERAVAAALSALLAVGGAYLVFGRIYIDPDTGGADLVRLLFGLIAATIVGAIVGYGRSAMKAVVPLLSGHFTTSLLRVSAVSLFVQVPMMIAYVAIAHTLAPNVALLDLAAAASVVMFAASIPISLAGWGIREMSAVAALGMIGVSNHAAFTTAIIVGFGSLFSMAIVAAISLPILKQETVEGAGSTSASTIDFTKALSWTLPLAAATFVLFQVYLPVGSGLLNINLADPIALIAAALFVVTAREAGARSLWRIPGLNVAVAMITAVLTLSLLIGVESFGYTTWAWVNRYLGWFVLLAYGATGALIVAKGGEEGRRAVLLTYIGATIAVSAVDIGTLLLKLFEVDLTKKQNLEAFSQNHNFFAFQLLMATSAIFVVVRDKRLRVALMSIALVAFWFAGSRSGWIALLSITGVAIYMNAIRFREVAFALLIASVTACVPFLAQVATPSRTATISQASSSNRAITSSHAATSNQANMNGNSVPIRPEIVPSVVSTRERTFSMVEGWKLFETAPVFGAGLGAFRHLGFQGSSPGIPLLIHSTALWLLAELGIVGFVVFAIAFVRIFLVETKTYTEEASAVAVLCMVAFAVMSGPADMLYQRTFWLLMGAALAYSGEPAVETPKLRVKTAASATA
ncbi:lysylphosphatidylglycerol synthase domain-containing protein [Bradyrhizobium erythrophlei]|uniref:O-Antigen ligase n=1 Tax=Bradyrhizobium erythrophlei TaxID=1437360 RepID=A0A1M7UHI1_9BRAD|nr:lysylphosphatidylglycerol synthase domain-containing protein [Bradyrhizobium erythrophlei]SHN82481.1 O-Antigen ligase [Bradyrhizobium erythrophlei]